MLRALRFLMVVLVAAAPGRALRGPGYQAAGSR
jgi:hypothetical protein